MSQIVRAITSHKAGERKILNGAYSPLFRDLFDVNSSMSKDINIQGSFASKYSITVKIGADVWVSEEESYASGRLALTEAINRTKRHVVEAIFGEFRQDLMQIQRALYDNDFKKSRELLDSLELKMFGVE